MLMKKSHLCRRGTERKSGEGPCRKKRSRTLELAAGERKRPLEGRGKPVFSGGTKAPAGVCIREKKGSPRIIGPEQRPTPGEKRWAVATRKRVFAVLKGSIQADFCQRERSSGTLERPREERRNKETKNPEKP